MRYLLAVLLTFSALPSSAMFKCVGAGGTVAFQEQPCEKTQVQTVVKPVDTTPAAAGAAAGRQSLDQQNRQYETERLQRDAAYALRDKAAELDQHRQRCDAQQREILSNRARANNNLAGAVYEQSIATEAAAAATRCETRGRDLQAELEEARRQCAMRGCSEVAR